MTALRLVPEGALRVMVDVLPHWRRLRRVRGALMDEIWRRYLRARFGRQVGT